MDRKVVNPWQWQDQYGFVQANEVSGAQRVLYCSGQVSVDSAGAPVNPGNMRAQVTQALNNVETVLGAAGFKLSDVVRLNFYTTDVDGIMEAWPAVKDRLASGGCRQASTLLGVAKLYHPDILVEVEATAAR